MLGFESYTLNPHNRVEETRHILSDSPFLELPFSSVYITYNVPESVLTPARLHDPTHASSTVSLIHGDMPSGIVLQEQVPGADIYNVYRVPAWLHKSLSGRFPNGEYWHSYTTLLRSMQARSRDWPATFLYIWFFPAHVIVSLQRSDRLQLMQSFPYETPEDLSYQLLNLAEQFGLDIAELQIYVSGLIDTESIIHNELLKYFLNVDPDPGRPDLVKGAVFHNFPGHYFTAASSLCPCG